MLKINGVSISTPSEFKVEINDLDGETNRNANGDLIRDRIAVKRKLICKWPPLSMSEISTLLKSVKAVYFNVEYPDPEEGAFITKNFYVGDRESPVYRVKSDGSITWESLNMNFIEK
ncbi:DUF6711 family protein [Neobacillus sp. NPDC058068]|uniref:DUF6711 family protein n=1 Tax=Neobacillus sp. NPDC058068 TaxID=3346325 RepID=UPI0036D7C1A0